MIVTRTPLRLSLGGGGTDLPNYAAAHGGFVLSAAVDHYVYVALRAGRVDGCMRFSHEHTTRVTDVENLDHSITREALRMVGADEPGEIVSMGGVPSGTGLGGSGSYAVGLLHALHASRGRRPAARELAEQAWDLERNRLGRSVGKHDHYLAALGGLQVLRIDRDGTVTVEPLSLPEGTVVDLERRLLLAYTGKRRDADAVLCRQDQPRQAGASEHYLHDIKKIGYRIADALRTRDLDRFGDLLHEHWLAKRASAGTTDEWLDRVYDTARRHGARGGKVVGAGGGGFFLFDTGPDHRGDVLVAVRQLGLRPVPFRFEPTGTRVVLADHERSYQ